MTAQLRFEHSIPLPREMVFAFHGNPECLAPLHAGWSTLRILKHESRVRVGGETWIEHTVAGLAPVVLGFKHISFEPPDRFGEELIHGPFSRFTHLHEFEQRNGETLVRDLLEVEWPWHYGGTTVMNRIIRPQITRMFRCRAKALSRLAGNGTLEQWAARNRGARNS